jgi:rhamnogalacturonan endolyase
MSFNFSRENGADSNDPARVGRVSPTNPWTFRIAVALVACLLIATFTARAQRQMENLGRGVVAVRSSSTQVFISWRLLGLDPSGIEFNVYRSANGGAAVKLNGASLSGGCNYTDTTANLTQSNAYHVRSVIGGIEQTASGAWMLPANAPVQPMFRIPLQNLTNHYVHFVWVGDLDGDGEYDFIVNRLGTVAGLTQKLEAYKRDGTFLWRVDFGPNSVDPDGVYPTSAAIDAGQWDGVTVYDLDGDGKAEVIVKSANGVTFGDGTTLVYGNNLTQFISVLDGMTGGEKGRVTLPNPWPSNGPLGTLFGVGYCDGTRPSLMIHAKNRVGGSGTPFNIIESAWDYRGGVITQRWSIQWNGASAPPVAHQMRIVDVNGDGKDDMVPGMHVVSGTGTLLYSLGDQGVGHGDRFHIGDLNPNRPGLEGYGIQQDNPNGLTEYFYDAATGQILWSVSLGPPGPDAARGIAADVNTNFPGYEVWSFYGMRSATGTQITADPNRPWPNFRIWWDGDVMSENLNREFVEKWNPTTLTTTRLLTASSYGAVDSWRDAAQFYGDIIGDWREEVIYEKNDHTEIQIFTTTIPSSVRLYTLPHNPAYRNCMSVKGYLQSHMVDYYLGQGMSNPPVPNIVYVTTNPPPPAPDAPTSLTATAVSATRIDLAWTDNSTNETDFRIERSLDGTNFTQVAQAAANLTALANTGLSPNTLYYYRVRASNAGGQSAYSNIASATTPVAPPVMIKSDTPTMSTAPDWSGITPAIDQVGLFNNVISAGNAAALSLGGDVAVGGLVFGGNLNGPVTIAAGNILTLGSSGIDMSTANQNVTFNQSTSLDAPQTWNVVSGRTLAVNGAISETGSGNGIVKTGTGTLSISGASSFVDGVTVNQGEVLVTGGTMPVKLNGGLFTVGAALSTPVHVSDNGGTISPNQNRTLSGAFTGSGSAAINIVVATRTLSFGANVFTDFTGTIALGTSVGGIRWNSSSFGGSDNVTFDLGNSTGYATRNNSAATVNLGALFGGAGTQIRNGGTTYAIGGQNVDCVFSGDIQGNAVVLKKGAATFTLDGANTYSGGTIISAGTLQIGSGGATGVPGSGNVTNNSALVFDRSNTISDSSFGVISGTGSVVQAGSGILTFTNVHNYSGPTTIESGMLALVGDGSISNSTSIQVGSGALFDVSGRSAGVMSLASGKTLSGNGAIKGDFIIGNGATLAPGNSIGTLTFSNALTLDPGSTSIFEISSGPVAHDQINVIGALTRGGTLVVTNIGNNPLTAGDNFLLLNSPTLSGSLNSLVLPPLSSGLAWDTNGFALTGVLAVVSLAPPTFDSAIRLTDGNIRLTFSGPTGQGYEIRASTNVVLTPITSWTLLGTGIFTGSPIAFDDLQATNFPQRFYLIRIT